MHKLMGHNLNLMGSCLMEVATKFQHDENLLRNEVSLHPIPSNGLRPCYDFLRRREYNVEHMLGIFKNLAELERENSFYGSLFFMAVRFYKVTLDTELVNTELLVQYVT